MAELRVRVDEDACAGNGVRGEVGEMKIFLTNSASHLGRSLKKHGFAVDQTEFYSFSDGEHGYRLKNKVEGESVGVVGSILPDPQSLFDLMALHHLVRENGARETNLIIPYLGYARQDRPNRPGEGSIGVMVVELLQKINPSRLFLIDVHSDLIRKAFGPSVKEISALSLFADTLLKHPPDVVVSPDAGFLSRAKQFAELFTPHPAVAVIDKVRPRPNRAIARCLHGDVRGKHVVIVDDMIDTGRTLAEAVRFVAREGAKTIRLGATHGIFSEDARQFLSGLPIDDILITNTLPQIRHPKIRILDICPLMLNALQHGSV
jgi:ribose-phosphate pyrophosphokinase